MEFLKEFDRVMALIEEYPLVGPQWPGLDAQGVRKASLARFPFSVAYVVLESRILILAVAHASRRPGYWRDRRRG